MRATFSVIIPTKGRVTLQRTLDSIVFQLDRNNDEIIVVSDGVIGPVEDMVNYYRDQFGIGIEFFASSKLSQDNGGTQRDLGIKAASGTHLLFMDDDDVFTGRALPMLRCALATSGFFMLPHMFRMRAGHGEPRVVGWGDMLWKKPAIEFGNVGTPMFVIPRLPLEMMPKWASFNKDSHDFEFIQAVVRLFGGQCIWRQEVIAVIRPTDEEAANELRTGL